MQYLEQTRFYDQTFVAFLLQTLKYLFVVTDVIVPPGIHLKNGQKIMLIDSPIGRYIQLQNKKLISLKSQMFEF